MRRELAGLFEEHAKRYARLCPAHSELAGLIEEHAKRYARFEGRGSMRDGCGSRRDAADAVAVVASAFEHAVGVEQRAAATVT